MLASSIQCREPKTGQLQVQLYNEDDPLCPTSYIIYLWKGGGVNLILLISQVPAPSRQLAEFLRQIWGGGRDIGEGEGERGGDKGRGGGNGEGGD